MARAFRWGRVTEVGHEIALGNQGGRVFLEVGWEAATPAWSGKLTPEEAKLLGTALTQAAFEADRDHEEKP